MEVVADQFSPKAFSFHEDPVLVLREFWSPEEQQMFREAMTAGLWTHLSDMPSVQAEFANCGNWAKGELLDPAKSHFQKRVMLSAVGDYIASFPDIVKGVLSFNYFWYRVGDCLSVHRDADSGEANNPMDARTRRRIALTTYMHEHWDPNWGGELILYERRPDQSMEITQCVSPDPGTLVLFKVPRHHRVCRVDPLAGDNPRLSVSGWFMTEHSAPTGEAIAP